MPTLSRRALLGAIPAAAAAPLFGRTLQTIGVQLYTLRSVLPKEPLKTLQALEEIGYREAEVISGGLDALWPSLTQTKLKPVSIHLSTPLFMAQADKLPAALEDAKKRGIQYAVCPYIAPQDRGGADVIKRLAETLNKAGAMCAQSGMTLCYHNHAFEFAPAGDGTLLDVLMTASDAKLVNLELDIMWSQVAGVDPVSVLKKYAGRVPLMHVKNVAKGVGPQFNEGVPRDAFKEVGAGVIDIAAVLKAAPAAGVKHYFVEQDQTPGDPLVSLRESFQYLSKLNY